MKEDDKIKCVKPDCDEEWNGVGTHQLCERCYNEWASNYFPIKDTRKPLVTYKDDEAGTELQVFEDDVPLTRMMGMRHKKGMMDNFDWDKLDEVLEEEVLEDEWNDDCKVADFFKAVSTSPTGGLRHPEDGERTSAYPSFPIDKECETSVRITDRMSLVTPAHPDECVYVRLVMDGQWEVAYWRWTEWQRDSTEVMGAIVGALNAQQIMEEE